MSFYQKILDYKAADKVYVMADLGSNYKTEKELFDAIHIAKSIGVDAIKYQFFGKNELHGPTFELNHDFPVAELSAVCAAQGIDFLCTGFSPEGYRFLDDHVAAHKIASSEMSHLRILETVRDLKKPIILSTGTYHPTDVKRVLNFLEGSEVIVMHSNTKYPAKFCDTAKFGTIRAMSPGPFGYSDHTTNIDLIPMWFKEKGISIYEKHFNPFDHADTPDAPQSLSAQEFKVLTAYMHNQLVPHTEENEARLKFIRRIVATKPIKVGDTFHEGDNMGIFRSRKEDANGLNSFFIDRLEGRIANENMEVGDGISVAHVKPD